MPYDIVAANSRATQVGATLGQVMFNNSLRMQQLQSEQAMQRLQQQHLAQQMAFALEAHDTAVQERADMTKAMARVQLESQPFLPAPAGSSEMGQMIGPDGASMGEAGKVPNFAYTPIDQSLMKNVLPVIAKYRPQEADNFIASAAMLPYRMAEAKLKEAEARQLASPEANGPGTIQPVTGNYPGAPTLNVFVPPRGRGAVQLVGDGQLQTVTGDDGRTYERMKDGSLKPLAATPDQQNAGRTKQKIISEALKIDPAQVGIDGTVTPEGWATIQAKGQVTPATRNVVEKQVVAGEQVIAAATNALDTIVSHPEAVGLRGAIGATIERGKGQLGMETNATTAKARQKLELAFTQLAAGLKVDSGNMSRYERNKLEEVGDPSRWQESPQTAAGMMENIRNAAIGQQLRRLHDIGKSPNPALLRSIPATEVAALVASHLLTDEEAFKWRELRRQK